jgi:hypothetical protein
MAKSSAKMPSPTAQQLRDLATSRLAESVALQGAGHPSAAWYLCGYVLELSLKAIVCKTLRVAEYPDGAFAGKAKTHDVDDLVLLAGLYTELRARLGDANFEQNWLLVTSWNTQDRYQMGRSGQDVDELLAAYQDAENGVFTWLSKLW